MTIFQNANAMSEKMPLALSHRASESKVPVAKIVNRIQEFWDIKENPFSQENLRKMDQNFPKEWFTGDCK
ncbi:hypothetical protein N8542_00665 [Verrucomicrobia bacterium]|nr:hypothetical protein [Verrucomicrobiota bacterium]